MRVLVGCEENGKVRDAFASIGHDAWSCDILPTRRPGNHLQIDIFEALTNCTPWDIVILHPDCTKLAVSGNRWYGKGAAKYLERVEAMNWTATLWETAKDIATIGVALENPIGVLPSTSMGKPTQYIHPWQFGHGETKKTCLWLYNLPRLKPTNIVKGREQRVWKMPPSAERKRLRSETYDGWAEAMAAQWGGLSI
jgi:hypothetical protein